MHGFTEPGGSLVVMVASGWQGGAGGRRDFDGVQADAHPLFERLSEEELEDDLAARMISKATEEGQKVERNTGQVMPRVLTAGT